MEHITVIILLALFGFLALAFILLAPVYRFLKREEKASEQWTREHQAPAHPPDPGGASFSNGAPREDGSRG